MFAVSHRQHVGLAMLSVCYSTQATCGDRRMTCLLFHTGNMWGQAYDVFAIHAGNMWRQAYDVFVISHRQHVGTGV